ncbi:MAG TPA: gamma-glutamyl-gamma-aminobutyrate hydrolase family protein [Micropepsaceae bacterium]|nr:gamma-glutamyl-gamma-aminobutyrate hydrolase family protein [Micropepsaceae bacterium]
MRPVSPIVGIVCDRRKIGDHAFHIVGEKYIDAVRDGAGALPLLIPALTPPLEPAQILASVDGLLFTGSSSNVAPRHYGGATPRRNTPLDEARDATAIPLMRAAEAAGVPMLCICRGFQELNVAFGGTLHQHLHEVKGFADHSVGDHKADLEEQYAPVHDVRVTPGGMLAELLPEFAPGGSFKVNSLHGQGIARLARPLRVEAEAPDGAIEAVSMDSAPGFLLGVQWHPEWRHAENAVSRAIFAAFGEAVRRAARNNIELASEETA